MMSPKPTSRKAAQRCPVTLTLFLTASFLQQLRRLESDV